MSAQSWDDRYRSQDRLFSGNPNEVLVTEIATLLPGRALDAGCGEGADAIWLAQRGWQVTAVDISRTALDRAAAATSAQLADRVTWTHADLTTTPPPAGPFDLVSLHYFPLPRHPGHTTPHTLLDAVAPGGTLLIVSHALSELPARPGFDPADYYHPEDFAGFLDATWTIKANETRPRTTPTHHTTDTVLRAQRHT